MNLSKTRNSLYYLVIVIVFANLLFFINLGEKGLWSSQEARNAIAAKTMLNGTFADWIVPTIEGQRSTQKPILYHWLVNLSCIAGGEVSPFFVRLPSVFCGLICAFYLFYLGQKLLSPKTGFLAAIILVTCIKFLHMSRTSRIDILLTVCLTICLGELLLFYLNGKLRHLYAGYFFSGLSFLSKGPIGIILPVIILTIFLLLKKDTGAIKKFLRPEAICFLLFTLIPYILLVLKITHGSFFEDFILKHNFERFLGAQGTFGKRKPLWFYIPHFLTGTMPWAFFIPLLTIYLRWHLTSKHPRETLSDTSAHCKTVHLFFTLVIGVIFTFFSLSSFKRSDYILPVFPAFSLLLGQCLTDEKFLGKKLNWIKGVMYVLTGIFLVCFPSAYIANYFKIYPTLCTCPFFQKYFNENDMTMIYSSFNYFDENKLSIFAVLLINIILSISLLLSKSTVKRILVSYVICFSSMYFFYYLNIEAALDKYCNLEPFSEKIKKIASPKQIVFFNGWNHSIAFYINPEIRAITTNDELIECAREKQLYYFITSPDTMNRLPSEIEKNAVVVLRTEPYLRNDFVLAKYCPSQDGYKSLTSGVE